MISLTSKIYIDRAMMIVACNLKGVPTFVLCRKNDGESNKR